MSIQDTLTLTADELHEFCGEGYFNVLVSKLSELIGSDYTYVAQIFDDTNEAETVSFFGGGAFFPTVKYDLKGTPCEDLRCNGDACILSGVADAYPTDTFLKDLAIEGYLGIVLRDNSEAVIGILSALFKHPILPEDQNKIRDYFLAFSTRSSNELERIKYESMLKDEISQLQEKNDRLKIAQQIYDFSRDGIIVTDANNNIVYINTSLSKISGYTSDELQGHNPRILNSGIQDKAFYQTIWAELEQNGYWQGELWNRHKNGNIYPVSTSISKIPDDKGHIKFYVAIHRDISKEKKTENLIKYQATHDSLTGMLNRYEFNQQLEQLILELKDLGQRGAFITLDLDDFKSINDTQGHDTGDKLLQRIADRINNCISKEDLIARLGGDEFSIFCPLTTNQEIEGLIERLLKSFKSVFEFEGLRLRSSTSIGISFFPDDADNAHELFKCSDQALYKAKRDGGANYAFYSPELGVAAVRHHELRLHLADAIEQKALTVNYQPIVDLVSNQVVRCEALARWTDPQLGTISPDEFIEVAEHSGLISQLGLVIAEKALSELKTINSMLKSPMRLSINRSPAEITDLLNGEDFLTSLIESTRTPIELIAVELTENFMVKDPVQAEFILSQMKDKGFKLLLDDFGTGYSSLAYLKRFPFDVLKIDRSFISDLSDSEDSYLLVKTVLEMAKNLGLECVAEGVESHRQLEILKEMGCRYIQGYYYAKPVNCEALIRYISEYFPIQIKRS